MAIVRLVDVAKVYPLGKMQVHALHRVSFAIDEGDFVSISGPSGSGKTTILNLIGCIDTATAGEVYVGGVETSSLDDRQITTLRHDVLGFIFQSFNLIPVLDVFENVEFPLLLGKSTMTKRERSEWVAYLIDDVGLAQWRTHKPNELSGGQRQRVAIARSLATKPRIVLADEPTANLDTKTSATIIELMKKMNREFNTTFVFSTHDPDIVAIADHVIQLRDGEVVEDTRLSAGGHAAPPAAVGVQGSRP